MKKYILFLTIVSLFFACEQQVPCNSVNLADKDYLKAKIGSANGDGGFIANGFTSFYVVEVDKSYPTDYNDYYEGNYGSGFTALKLPIAHNYAQTTFVFKGDTVQPETLMVNNYNARAELTKDCGYRLTIDKPSIGVCTFAQISSNPEFDETNKILKIQLLK